MIKRYLVFLTTSLLIGGTHGYASWLKCFVELDESEVIMNHRVLPVEQAKAPVSIEVLVEGEEEWTAGETFFYASSSPDSSRDYVTIHARLRVPSSLEYEDVQYVMEVKNAGTFEGVGVMCDGKRGFSRQYDEAVILKLPREEVEGSPIQLVAGWAIGHDAVSLTPAMTLKGTGRQHEL